MQNLRILNKKEIKEILAQLKNQFGFEEKLDYAFLKSEKGKVFIIDSNISKIDFKKLRINNLGLYIIYSNNNELRLTIEGSQLIGPKSKKNILELNNEESREWMQGLDLEKETKLKGFVILKHNNDFLGSGKIKENKILNFVPKERRINS